MSSLGKVPMFKMRPQKGTLACAIVVIMLGGAVYLHALEDPADLDGQARAKLIFAICVVFSGLLTILATARMWFRHLWHDRYRK